MKKQFRHLMVAIILIAASVTVHAQPPNWLTAGNAGATNFKLGTTNGFNLNIVANNKTRMIFEKAMTNSSIEIGAGTPILNYGVHLYGGLGDVLSQGLYIQRADNGGTGVQDCSLAIAFSSNLFTGVGIGGGSCGFVLFPSNGDIPDMAFSTNNVSPQMIIKNGGNVGINTPLPLFKLDLTTTTSNDACRLTQAGSSGSIGLQLNNTSANGRNWAIKSLGNGDVDGAGNFSLYDLTSGINDMLIYGNSSTNVTNNYEGNIGIGTTTPTVAKLQVNKNIVPLGSYVAYRGVQGTIQNTSPVPNGGATFSIIGTEGDATVGNFTPILGFAYGVLGQALNGQGNYGGYFNAVGPSTGPTDGNYGIYASGSGNNNSALNWGGYFAGNVYTTGVYISSDQKLKNDIKPLAGALDKLMLLKPSTYTFKTEEFKNMNLPHGNQIGLIAQDLETVFPELVVDMPELNVKNTNGEGSVTNPSFKAVQYIGLIPVLIASVQEQQKQITEQKLANDAQLQEINDLKSQLASMNARLDALETAHGSSFDYKSVSGSQSTAVLEQIAPNPFSQNATITFYLPSDVSGAQLIITDATGKTVMTYALSNGATQQVISASSLAAGSYRYSLMVNGKVIDSKQMVIVK